MRLAVASDSYLQHRMPLIEVIMPQLCHPTRFGSTLGLVRSQRHTVQFMSLPKDLLDQLLSGYLDDALSADERSRVDHLLKTDDSVVEELAQLQDLRKSLRAVSKADSDIRLDAGFADRVLGEAVARARAEGLSEDHPLIRLEEQPSKAAPVAPNSTWKVASVMVALAASIVFAVVMLRPDVPTPGESEIAAVDPVNVTPIIPEESGSDPDAPNVVPDVGVGEVVIPTPEMVAESGDRSPNPPEIDEPSVTTAEESVAPATDVKPDMSAIASSEQGTLLDVSPNDVVAVNPDQAMPRMSAIMVLSIVRTEAGRQAHAVRQAMELASIGSPSEKKISEDVAGFVKDTAVDDESEEYSVVYLHAPAKDLDKLYLGLIADEAGVESIGMTLAMDVPVMNVVKSLRQDPKTVRHEPSSLRLVSDDAALRQLAGELGGMEYMSVRGATPPSSGSDEMAEMLLLVK